MKQDEQLVKQHNPFAELHQFKSEWHVVPGPSTPAIIGKGSTPEEAWANAAARIKQQINQI